MAECPSDADLAGFLNESLPPERLAGLSAHVDGCPGCQVRLDSLTQDADGAVARYKELSSVITSGTGPKTQPVSQDDGTLILGGNQPAPGAPRLHGVPRVPGFDVDAEIGRGGMGVVYKARHRGLNRLCALKMVLAGGAADTVTVQRFLFEAEILARVQHSQVVQVFEVDTYQGPSGVPIPYLAMELLEGGSLAARIKEGPLEPLAAAELIEGIARAVHAAHLQGVIHRDLKPGNILFPESGVRNPDSGVTPDRPPSSGSGSKSDSARFAPKVTDFGLAKFIEAGAEMTQSGQVVGTPHYMAPEQAAGSKQIGPSADVYALGAILFECLTGRRPFEGDEPMSVLLKVVNEPAPDVRSIRRDVPRDLAAVVARCLDKEPRRRYPSATDLADDLRRFLENRPTAARPLRRRERLWLWAKRNPAVAGLAVALASVLVVAFALVTWFWLEAEQNAQDERHAKFLSEHSEKRAREQAQRAMDALDEAQRQKRLATEREAEVEFRRAVSLCDEGRVEEGLQLFVRVVELAQASNAANLERAARVNLAAWTRELPPSRRPFRHTGQPRLAAFLPDGKRMVTAGRDGEMFLWNLATGEKLRTYKPAPIVLPFVVDPTKTYWTVAVSPDGRTIAAGASDGRVILWDVDKSEHRLAFDTVSSNGMVWSIAYAPDGTLWVADGDGVRRWDLNAKPKPKPVAQLNAGAIVNVLVLTPDGKRVFTGDRLGLVREFDAQKTKLRGEWRVGNWVQDLAISPDGLRLAATGPDGFAHVIDRTMDPADRGSIVEIPLGGANGNGIAFAPKRPFVLTSDGDGNVRFWHQDTGHTIGIPMRFVGEVTRMRFRPDSDEFAVPAGDTIYVCGVPDPPSDLIYAGRGTRIRGLDFSPDGERIAVAAEEAFEVFDTAGHSVQQLAHFRRGMPRMSFPLVARFDPDPARSRVFRGTRNGLDWVAVPDGKVAEEVPLLFPGRIYRIEFLPRGAGMFVMDTSLLTRYDLTNLKRIKGARPAGSGTVPDLQACAVRPDGGEVLVTYGDRVVFLDPTTLQPSRPGWTTGDEIADAVYTPDGRAVLVGRRDNVAELLDAKTGARLIRAMPHTRGVTAVSVSPDGKILLTGCRDGTARFWDAGSGYPLGAPLRHLAPVLLARYGPKGEHVATGTATGHVMLWDVPPPPTTKTLDELRAGLLK